MQITYKTTRQLIALVLASSLAGNSSAMSMQELFDNVNAQGNVSSAAVLQGQTMNVYTGGSMFMRMPKRTYNLTSFTPPSWSAGCGGIDLYAGGFSFINKEQFVAMLRNIGSNALGYGFKLAIQNLCPTCDNVMQALQATSQAINRQNLDSCAAAKGIVSAALPDTWTRDKQNAAKNFGVNTGLYSDITDAWTNVMDSQEEANETINKVAKDNPDLKSALPVGNVTWNALSTIDGLEKDYKMLIMSMVGTTIFATENRTDPIVLAKKEITVQSMLGGNVVDDDGKPVDKIELPIWKCGTDDPDCLTVTEGTLETDSFRALIRKKMNAITDKIASREAYENPDAVMQFLNATDLPVYKMIAVATTLDNTAMADNLVNRYQELIAAKYAEVYIRRAAEDLRAALSNYSAHVGPTETEALEKLQPKITQLQEQARQVVSSAYTQTISTYNIGLEVAHLERVLNANLSQTLRNSIAFAKSLR